MEPGVVRDVPFVPEEVLEGNHSRVAEDDHERDERVCPPRHTGTAPMQPCEGNEREQAFGDDDREDVPKHFAWGGRWRVRRVSRPAPPPVPRGRSGLPLFLSSPTA